MANYSVLKTTISNAIKANGNQEITGQLLQTILTTMVSSLGNKYQIAGVALTTDSPGTPDFNVAYIAGPGRYANFGGLTVPGGSIGLLCYNGTWTLQSLSLSGLQNGYAFLGVLQPTQNLPTVSNNSFFLCGQGTYGSVGTVAAGELGVLIYTSNSWNLNRISFGTGSTVQWNQIQASGVKIAEITIDGGSPIEVFAPAGGSGGSVVTFQQVLASGTKIAEISIDGTTTEIFAPTPSAAENFFENVNNAASLKSTFTAGITTPQGDITAPAGVVFGKSSGKITVGTGADFNTLSAALAYASKFSHIYNNSGNTLTIEIRANFPISEQLVIDGIDLSYINITLQNFTPMRLLDYNCRSYLDGDLEQSYVLVDLINNQTFMTLKNGARGPRLSCIFRAVVSRNVTGIVLDGGSEIHIDSFCGLEYFRTPLTVKNGSRVFAYGGIIRGANNVKSNIVAESGSFVDFTKGMFSRNDAATIVGASGASRVVIDASYIKGETADISGDIYADAGAKINATELNLMDINTNVLCVAGEVNIGAISATIPTEVEHGGIIRVVSGTAVPASGTINTLSADGIIFN